MQPFQPGEDYLGPYQTLIWVCVNPIERSFERCDVAESLTVLNAFKSTLARYGLSQQAFVISSGCQLGCQAQGTSVVINRRQADAWSQTCFKGVTAQDVDTLVQQFIQTAPPRPSG